MDAGQHRRPCDQLETPAIVNDNGTLRMVFTDEGADFSELYEAELRYTEDGEPEWTVIDSLTDEAGDGLQRPSAPALAFFNGQVHLLYADVGRQRICHLVRRNGRWDAASSRAAELHDSFDAVLKKRLKEEHGYPGNLATAVHDGKLHLLYRITQAKGYLFHTAFDGTSWSNPAGGVLTRRTAALASYDGKLHAVFPSPTTDNLAHATWTEADGWSKVQNLDGHDSRNTPALVAFKDGPAGEEREALLLVRRGVDRYVAPPPRRRPRRASSARARRSHPSGSPTTATAAGPPSSTASP
ncbi:hypothetical protein ACIO1C_27510 [Streptomyces sp. NPDC087420]|uniref:hypothetical protein n=1 Tax=Streptomyces sp. NPDC087420 TaxID=3365785 RepID=UPI003839BAE7